MFAIVGVVGLVILVAITTIALRRSRRRRLHDDAISFNPGFSDGSHADRGSVEKRRFSLLSSDHGHGSNSGGGYTIAPAVATYPRQDLYRTAASESQHNLIGHPQQAWYGGAAVDSPYGGTRGPRSDLGPALMYGIEKTSTPSGRARRPESVVYPQPANLKVTSSSPLANLKQG